MKEGKLYLLPVLAGTNYEAVAEMSAKAEIKYIPLTHVNPLRTLEAVHAKTQFRITDRVVLLMQKRAGETIMRSISRSAS